MTNSEIIGLFITMVVVVAIPGIGVITVISRSLTSGFFHGFVTTLGVISGDYIFILLSIYGLSTIASTMGPLFFTIKYVGVAYLIWMGIKTLRLKPKAKSIESKNEFSWFKNYLVGLTTTLGNPKAILFYVSILPSFVDISAINTNEVVTLMFVITLAVLSVMLSYAFLASKASTLFKSTKLEKRINMTSGSLMIGAGTLLATKA